MKLKSENVEWVVNDMAELGVKIGDQFFFLYKGRSLEYTEPVPEDSEKIKWRYVGKREFGETCQPWDHMARVKGIQPDYKGFRLPETYVGFHPEESQPDYDNPWRDLP